MPSDVIVKKKVQYQQGAAEIANMAWQVIDLFYEELEKWKLIVGDYPDLQIGRKAKKPQRFRLRRFFGGMPHVFALIGGVPVCTICLKEKPSCHSHRCHGRSPALVKLIINKRGHQIVQLSTGAANFSLVWPVGALPMVPTLSC